ncbi:MAG: M17 family metallopeptidase [Hyphomicrobiaceae bacterium]
MTDSGANRVAPADLLLAAADASSARQVWLATEAAGLELPGLTAAHRNWLTALGFKARPKQLALLPGDNGNLSGAVMGLGDGRTGEPAGPGELLAGQLATGLPPGDYEFTGHLDAPELAAIAFGLGAYRFRRYKTADAKDGPVRLRLSSGVDRDRVLAIVESVWLGRDLINTPASDMGPEQLELAARELGKRHGAEVSAIVGDDLLARDFPMIHAVGRASNRAPRLIDMTWGRTGAPRITLVGKGICFDTGGLDLKPASGMLLMKKDMAGAATALTLASMIMTLRLDVRLRVLIPAAENSVSGNAYRPQDVVRTRDGRTVEIGNTDAEGRLVLSDALSLADEEEPDALLTFSTLTGAARVALGPDLPALFTDDDAFAAEIAAAGTSVGDPVWRMPFWPGYERNLDNEVADMCNVSEGPFAGSVTAALFLRRFVKNAKRFAHFDMYGWRPAARPLGPKGGEPHVARCLLAALESRYRRTA